MKQTVYLSSFRDAFIKAGRKDQFSYEGLGLLFDYFEQYEDDTGEEMELDVIGICCEYAEDTPENIASYYDIDLDGVAEDDISQVVKDYLCDSTPVIGITSSGSIVYQSF